MARTWQQIVHVGGMGVDRRRVEVDRIEVEMSSMNLVEGSSGWKASKLETTERCEYDMRKFRKLIVEATSMNLQTIHLVGPYIVSRIDPC
jgi:hypothetical protein